MYPSHEMVFHILQLDSVLEGGHILLWMYGAESADGNHDRLHGEKYDNLIRHGVLQYIHDNADK